VCSSVQGGSNSTTVHCGPDRKMSPHWSSKCRRAGLRDCWVKRPDVTPRGSRSRSGSMQVIRDETSYGSLSMFPHVVAMGNFAHREPRGRVSSPSFGERPAAEDTLGPFRGRRRRGAGSLRDHPKSSLRRRVGFVPPERDAGPDDPRVRDRRVFEPQAGAGDGRFRGRPFR